MRPLEKKLLKFFGVATLVTVLLLMVAPVLFCPYCNYKSASLRTACLSNLKRQADGEIVYASDHDDRFTRQDVWVDGIAPYVKEKSVFHDPTLAKDAYGYAFNAALSIAKTPKSPEKVPMVYDSVNPIRNASDLVTSLPRPGRHHGRDNIGYADGHAKSVPMR